MENKMKEGDIIFTLKTNATEYGEGILYRSNGDDTFYSEIQGCVQERFNSWYSMTLNIAYILENETENGNKYTLWGELNQVTL